MKSDHRSILSSASLVSGLTLFSRLLGVVRDGVLSRLLGDTRFYTIFLISFEIPNLARRTLGEGALSAFIVPIYHKTEKEGGREEANRFFNRAVSVMILFSGALALLGVVFSKQLFLIFTGGKYLLTDNPENALNVALGATLTRVMFPYLLILTLAALFMGVCHAHRRFLSPALGSSVINITLIIAALAAGSYSPFWIVHVLAWAVILGIILRLALMIPDLWSIGWRFHWDPTWRDPAIGAMFSKMGAASLAMGMAQFNVLVNKSLAVWCGEETVTYLNNSNRLIQFPLAILASALATALVPVISKNYIDGHYDKVRDLGRSAVRGLMFLILPAMVGFWALGGPIVAMIFEGGLWDSQASERTAFTLSMYAVGLVPLAALRLLIPLYYAKGDVKTPVKVGAVALVINLVSNLILMRTALSYAGLALGGSIAAAFNAAALWIILKRDVGSLWSARLGGSMLRCAEAALIMGAGILTARFWWEASFPPGDFWARAMEALSLSALGAMIYIVAIWALGATELKEFMNLIRRQKVGETS